MILALSPRWRTVLPSCTPARSSKPATGERFTTIPITPTLPSCLTPYPRAKNAAMPCKPSKGVSRKRRSIPMDVASPIGVPKSWTAAIPFCRHQLRLEPDITPHVTFTTLILIARTMRRRLLPLQPQPPQHLLPLPNPTSPMNGSFR